MNGWLFTPEFFTAVSLAAITAAAIIQVLKSWLKFTGMAAVVLSVLASFIVGLTQIGHGAVGYIIFSVVLALQMNGVIQLAKQYVRK